MLLSEEEARKRIKALPAGPEPRIKWAGFDLPGEIAEGNFLTVGAFGMGKTSMHRELLRSLIPSVRPGSDCRAVVFDTKCDLISKLPASELIIFNPVDKRSVAWDIAADVNSPSQAHAFAEGLLQNKTEGSQFFTKSASVIVAGVINSLNQTHSENWDLRRLILLTTDRRKLESVLVGSDLIQQYFSQPVTFANIQSTIVARMAGLFDGFHPLIAPCEGKFFSLIRSPRTDDAHDGDEPINFLHVAHSAETRHRWAFNMVNGTGVTAGDHFPHVFVRPRLNGIRVSEQEFSIRLLSCHAMLQIHFNSAPAQHGFNIAHRSQPSLSQDVHFNEADLFDRIHVEMCCGVAFVRDEGWRQFVHRLPRENDSARVHFGITRHPIQKLGHFEGGFVRLVLEREVPIFWTGFEHFD
jgi:hypothetical protein